MGGATYFVGGAFPVYRDLLLNKPFHRFGLARTENIVGKCKSNT